MFIFHQSNLKNKAKFIPVLLKKKKTPYTGMSICTKLKCNIFRMLYNASIIYFDIKEILFNHRCNYTVSIRYLLTMFLVQCLKQSVQQFKNNV